MAEQRVQRRLAAILVADVVGYSRLMAADEEGTLARMKALRGDVIDPKVGEYGGRIFKTTGDGFLAEFPSAVDAVRHAVDVQRVMARLNADVPEDSRIALRIGVSLGDVMVDGDDLFGNGVNVAARMEGLAEVGGICVSGNVQEHIGSSADLSLEDLGERTVKNIDRPVRCYRVHLVSPGTAEAPSPPLPDKPSIAVLPFENMSGDPDQEYFSDGISEDIITALSHLSGLDVLARNTSFVFKGKSVDVKQVGDDLGVRYVLEGSVRRSGDRVRVTAQLIDGASGHHLWADRFDRDLTDLFAVQDEITANIVSALDIELVHGEQARGWREGTENVDAWLNVIQARAFFYQATRDAHVRAARLLKQAVALDPDYATAWTHLAWIDAVDACFGWERDIEKALGRAEERIARAVDLDVDSSMAHTVLGMCHLARREHADAIAQAEEAVEMESTGENLGMLARILKDAGRPNEALRMLSRLKQVMPFTPPPYYWFEGDIYRLLGQHEKAIAAFEQMRKMQGNAWQVPLFLAAIYGETGREEDARKEVEALLKLDPDYTLRRLKVFATYSDPAESERIISALRKAGLPE